jgi:3-deoxy-manno-octulosonate cytidylyltransferase (CMP-KDO synthetase)
MMARVKATVIIPARMGSTRFPGKVLASATGKPLIQHVHDAAARAECAERVIVATDDERVRAAVVAFGGVCVMTRADHPNGTSRIAEAAASLGLSGDSIVVNVQGDEPELEPTVIDRAVSALERTGAPVATVAQPFGEGESPADPNLVKVVLRCDGTAMYFSRALIPHVRDSGADGVTPLKHLGLYVYRRAFLDGYLKLQPTELEKKEQLEQLRILYHGHAIAVAVVEGRGFGGIDTPEQYDAFVKRWREGNRRPR